MKKVCNLVIPSSLMFGLSEQFLVLVLAHFLLTPFNNAPHRLTSFLIDSNRSYKPYLTYLLLNSFAWSMNASS